MGFNELIELTKHIDLQNIICMISVGIYIKRSVDSKIDKLDERLTKRIDSLDERLTKRIDSLDEKLTDVDRRLCRMEGAFSRQECCVIRENNQQREAN